MHDREHHCIYCSSSAASMLYPTETLTGEKFFICACNNCGAVFLSPSPTEAQLDRAYDESYYGPREGKFWWGIERAVEWFRQHRARSIRKLCRPPATVLDIGCGRGGFLKHLARMGYECVGLERPGRAAELAAKVPGVTVRVGQLEKTTFSRGQFDVVTLWHVIEHVSDVRQTMALLPHILKKGGHLAVSLPNITSWQSKLFRGSWFHLDAPRHLIFFSPGMLEREFSALGFTLIRRTFFSLEQNVFGFQQSLLNLCCARRNVLYESLKGNKELISGYPVLKLRLQQLFFVLSFPLFTILAMLEALGGRGGTMEMYFRKDREPTSEL